MNKYHYEFYNLCYRYQSVQPRDQAETDERYRQLEHAEESQDPHYMEVIDSNDVAH